MDCKTNKFTWRSGLFKRLVRNNYARQEITIGIRPEDISIENSTEKSIELESELDVIEPMGNETFIYF